MAWRYLAFRLNGNGTETLLSNDVPVQDGQIREDLSGPGGIDGSITPEMSRLQTPDGTPLFLPWATAIYAEKDGAIRGGAILDDLIETGPTLELSTVGFTGYLTGQPYEGNISRIQVDPLEMARHLWAHKQSRTRGNLGITLDSTASPVRIGTKEEEVKFTTGNGEEVNFQTGPYTLQWWKDHDMGKAFDDLATETPFDYLMTHEWSGERVKHHLRLGYPVIGRRRNDLRFVLGENTFTPPAISYDGDSFASEVVVLGAGEGSRMIRGWSARTTDRLHRVAVVVDKTLRNKKSADTIAAQELAARIGDEDLDTWTVQEHPNAPLGSFAPGDEIFIQAPAGWTKPLYLWVRILSIVTQPDLDQATLTVARTDRMG